VKVTKKIDKIIKKTLAKIFKPAKTKSSLIIVIIVLKKILFSIIMANKNNNYNKLNEEEQKDEKRGIITCYFRYRSFCYCS
jgi:hypothetical protein